MLSSFLDFVIDVLSGMIEILQYTNIGGVTLEFIIVAIAVISIVAGVLVVSFNHRSGG